MNECEVSNPKRIGSRSEVPGSANTGTSELRAETVSATELRTDLGKHLEALEEGKIAFLLKRREEPVAVLLDIADVLDDNKLTKIKTAVWKELQRSAYFA